MASSLHVYKWHSPNYLIFATVRVLTLLVKWNAIGISCNLLWIRSLNLADRAHMLAQDIAAPHCFDLLTSCRCMKPCYPDAEHTGNHNIPVHSAAMQRSDQGCRVVVISVPPGLESTTFILCTTRQCCDLCASSKLLMAFLASKPKWLRSDARTVIRELS